LGGNPPGGGGGVARASGKGTGINEKRRKGVRRRAQKVHWGKTDDKVGYPWGSFREKKKMKSGYERMRMNACVAGRRTIAPAEKRKRVKKISFKVSGTVAPGPP